MNNITKTGIKSVSSSNLKSKTNNKPIITQSKINTNIKAEKDLKSKIKKTFNPFESLLNEGDLNEENFKNIKTDKCKDNKNKNQPYNTEKNTNTSKLKNQSNNYNKNKKILSPIVENEELLLSPENRNINQVPNSHIQLNNSNLQCNESDSNENNYSSSFDQSKINNDNFDTLDDATY